MDAQQELRKIKNQIIGNPDAKDSIAQQDESLARVLQCLDPSYSSPTRIEAANVLYSISSGSQDAVASLVRHRAHATLLASIISLEPASPHRLKSALGRALRTLMGTLADHSPGPQLWGILHSTPLHLRKEAQFALEELFQPTSLDSWLPLLHDSVFYPFLCVAISTSVRTPAHRSVICEWMPPAERAKASKGKRGWEKPATPLSPSGASFTTATSQGWVIRHLLASSLEQTAATTQAVVPSLEALAALCQDNPTACALLRVDLGVHSTDHSSSGALQPLLLQLRSPNPDVRLATAQLLANIIKTFLTPQHNPSNPNMPPGFHRIGGPSPREDAAHESALSTCLTILHTLLNMIRSEDETLSIRTKACFILSKLLSDDRTITESAVDCGALQALFIAMERTMKQAPTTNTQEPNEPQSIEIELDTPTEEEESLEELQLREAAFTSLATIGLTDSQYSRQVLEMDASRGQPPPSIPLVSSRYHSSTSYTPGASKTTDDVQPFLFGLLSKSITHQNLGVRYSALQVVRALTRALAVLRTGLVDTDVPMKVIEVVSGGAIVNGDTVKGDIEKEQEEGKDEEHRAVIIAALMALCNLVNDYAPFREAIIQGGAIRHLVRRTHSLDDGIRLNALWAIKNALFNAKSQEVIAIMQVMTWDHYATLAEDSDRRIREQSIILLQNITISSHDIAFVVDGLGHERLTKILQKSMSNNDPKAVEHAIRALINISTGYESHRDLVLQESLLILIRKNLTHSLVSVRCAAAECICELLARRPFRHRELRDAGIEQALRAVMGGRERSLGGPYHPHHYTLPISPHANTTAASASGFGAALASTGSFGPPLASTTAASVAPGRGGSRGDVMMDSPGLMGRESDREVLDAVKFALTLFERGKE